MRPKILSLIIYFCCFYLILHIASSLGTDKVLDFGQWLKRIGSDFMSRSFFVFLINTLLTYLIFYYLYPSRGAVFTVLVYLLICLPILVGLRFLIEEVLFFYLTGHHNYNMKYLTPLIYLKDNIYFAIYYYTMGIVFFAIQYENYSKLREKELKLQARNAELSFLKSQINPHFLFNNLNNIYTLVYQNSANALPAIGKLSELMRYMLYEKDEFVPLHKEIEYLDNFIDLQLMRYDYVPEKVINIQRDISPDVKIIPLSLIPFVENAFKHGDLKDPNYPLCIDLQVHADQLLFKVSNKKNQYRKDQTGGIGLQNVKKRLELLNKSNYNLAIQETAVSFTVVLNMKINA